MRSCPSCDSHDLTPIEYEDGCILICRNCALQFASYTPRDAGRSVTIRSDGMLRSTGNRYMDPASLGDPYQYQPYRDFFRHIDGMFGVGARLRILDIGCGNGFFLQHCLDKGHDAYGVEINTELKPLLPASAAARVVWGSAESLADLPLDEFDVITFWDSFEHMENGFAVLETLRRRLAPGGVVYLRVNNNHDIFNLISLLLYRAAPGLGKNMLRSCFGFPSHLWNFSVRGMTNLAHGHGWKVTAISIGETPASRLAPNLPVLVMIKIGYLVNRIIGGGKIGNYYLGSDKAA